MMVQTGFLPTSFTKSVTRKTTLVKAKQPRCIAVGAVAALMVLSISSCAPTSETPVKEYVDKAVEGLSGGYYANSPEWDAAISESLPQLYAAASVPDTYPLLRRLTKIAGGPHSRFSTPAEAAAWEQPYQPGLVPLPTVRFDDTVATITIPAFSSPQQSDINEYLEAAAEILASPRAHSACGWVIDVAGNTGGDPRVMLAALTPLLEDGVVIMLRDRDGATSNVTVRSNAITGAGEEWSNLPGGPAKLSDRPIGIVQGGATASAGEWVVVAFTGQKNVRTFGSATGGFTTVNDGFTLPDGAVVTLSFAVMGDRKGIFYTAPIQPDHAPSQGDGTAASMARDWVIGQCADRRALLLADASTAP